MTDLILANQYNLPANLEDLAKFVLIGRDKLQAVRAEINAISKLDVAREVREQKLAEAQEIGALVLLAEAKCGELFNSLPKAKENQYTKNAVSRRVEKANIDEKPKLEVAKELGFSKDQVSQFQKLADNPALVQKTIAHAKDNDDIPTRSAVLGELKKITKQKEIEKAKADVAAQQKNCAGLACLKVGNGIGFESAEPYNLLLTDPPYSTDVEDVDAFAKSWLPNALNHVKDDGFAYIFIGAYPAELKAYLNIVPPQHLNLIQVLIWTYKNTLGNNPKDRYKLNYQACLFYRGINAPALDCPLTKEQWAVQDINAPDGRLGDRFHSWQKPMQIAERFIRHSTKCGDTVFDPFACTGTFLLAAAKLGRNAYGFEINPDNAQIAFERGVKNGW